MYSLTVQGGVRKSIPSSAPLGAQNEKLSLNASASKSLTSAVCDNSTFAFRLGSSFNGDVTASLNALVAKLDIRKTEEPSELFPLQPQGLFENISHTKSEIDRAMKVYQHFNTAKSVLHYEGSSLEDITQNLVARIEDLLSLIVLLSEVRTVPAILATVQLYVRTYFAAPLTPIIWSYVKPQLDKLVAATAKLHGFTPQAAYEDSSDETEKIIGSLRGAITDWKIHRDGPFAKAFGGLISTLIAFGAFPDWEENAALSSFLKAFRVKTWDVQKDSINLQTWYWSQSCSSLREVTQLTSCKIYLSSSFLTMPLLSLSASTPYSCQHSRYWTPGN